MIKLNKLIQEHTLPPRVEQLRRADYFSIEKSRTSEQTHEV